MHGRFFRNVAALPVMLWLLSGMTLFMMYWYLVSPYGVFDTQSIIFIQHLRDYFLQYTNIALASLSGLCFVTGKKIQTVIASRFGFCLFVNLGIYQTLIFINLAWPYNLFLASLTGLVGLLFCAATLIYLFRNRKPRVFYGCLVMVGILTVSGLPVIADSVTSTTSNPVLYYLFGTNSLNLFLLLPLILFMGWVIDPVMTMAFLKDARYLRITHYLLMLILGIVLGFVHLPYEMIQTLFLVPTVVINAVLSAMSLFFAALFAITFNNISDVNIDRISNVDRPLIVNAIPVTVYTMFGWSCGGLSLFYAFMVGYKAVLLIGACMANYWMYSMPPYRFKRIPVLSKMVISMNSILMIVLGYLLVQNQINGMPVAIYIIFLSLFTLSANVIDLKDVAGDRLGGVMTLPMLIGESAAKKVIGIAALASCAAFGVLLNHVFIWAGLILAGCYQYHLINRQPYIEKNIILFSNLSFLCLIGLLLVEKAGFG